MSARPSPQNNAMFCRRRCSFFTQIFAPYLHALFLTYPNPDFSTEGLTSFGASFGHFAVSVDEPDESSSIGTDRGFYRAHPFKAFLNWRKGAVMESTSSNHQYSKEEQEKLKEFESLTYQPPCSDVYKEWLRDQPHT